MITGETHRHMPDETPEFLLAPNEYVIPSPRKDRRIMLLCFAAAFLSLGYCLGPYIIAAFSIFN